MAVRHTPSAQVLNPILLWLLIHGGDPPPAARLSEQATAEAIYALAGMLAAPARAQVQAAVAGMRAAS